MQSAFKEIFTNQERVKKAKNPAWTQEQGKTG